MSWHTIDLKKQLDKQKQLPPDEAEKCLAGYYELLRNDDRQEVLLRHHLKHPRPQKKIRVLDPSLVYDANEIRNLCVRYRLRFLSSKYFKADLPPEAVSRIKKLERELQHPLSDFYILAPAPVFHLKDRDKDPILFLKIGEGQYYFIHKWGQDMSFLRSVLVFPFRSFTSLLGCVALLAFLVVSLIPDRIIMGPYDQQSLHLRAIFFFYLFIAFSGLTVLYGFSRVKNFNGNLWNSPYLD